MALEKTGFFNFGELKKKEYDKKVIVISPNAGALARNQGDIPVKDRKNDLGVGSVVGFLDELPRFTATANWKSYTELLGDAVGDMSTLKDTLSAVTGSTDMMYGDFTAKFFTGGGDVSFDCSMRCMSYTPWESRYSGLVQSETIEGKQYLIGDCRTSANKILSLCFPGHTESIGLNGLKALGESKTKAGGAIVNVLSGNETNAGFYKDIADGFMSGMSRNQPTVSVAIGYGDVAYFSSNKMIVKSVNWSLSEEWVKVSESSSPVPMYVDINVVLELSQLAGLTDFANKGNAISINFK